MINDSNITKPSAGNSDMKDGNNVAIAVIGRNQTIGEEVHTTPHLGRETGAGVVGSSEVAGTLTASRGTGFRSNGTPIEGVAITPKGPRRFTPREYERLQGIPDDYTAITYRNKPACDSPRYKALGNSIVVPILHCLGKRIAKAFAVDRLPEPAPERTPPMQEARDLILRDEPGKT